MKNLRTFLFVVLGGVVFASGIPAGAHRSVTVTICIPDYPGGPCADRDAPPSYRYGKTIVVKGRTSPKHEGRVKVKRKKGDGDWRVVAQVELAEGHYRYEWETRRRHADQDTPYRFKVTLPGHDTSRGQRVYVLFGE